MTRVTRDHLWKINTNTHKTGPSEITTKQWTRVYYIRITVFMTELSHWQRLARNLLVWKLDTEESRWMKNRSIRDERPETDIKSVMDHKWRNEWVLKKAGVTRTLLVTVKARKMRYFGHIMRSNGSCLERDRPRHTTRKKKKRRTTNLMDGQHRAVLATCILSVTVSPPFFKFYHNFIWSNLWSVVCFKARDASDMRGGGSLSYLSFTPSASSPL